MSMRGSWVDKSGTITTGGTAQTVAVANPGRRYLRITNISDTAMEVNIGAVATADSMPLAVTSGTLQFDVFCPTGLVSIMCATTGKKFIVKEA